MTSKAPWKIVFAYGPDGNDPAADHIVCADGEIIADVSQCVKPTHEHEANAMLMATAPDLLAALRGIAPYLPRERDGDRQYAAAIDAVNAAIRRAEGGNS